MSANKREDILRKVQGLLAKAMSTPFEAEADTFRAKANELMDRYRLEQWEIAQVEAGKARSSLKPIRRDIIIEWWYTEKFAFKQALWTVFDECARHCAVVVANTKVNAATRGIPAYGLESDLSFLEMLFTDLYIQMADKIKPEFKPDETLGSNVYRAKEAGMKYKQIAIWAGHPEYITTVMRYDKSRGYDVPKTEISGILIREMKKHAKAHGLEVHKVINLDAYVEDFCSSFAWAVKTKLKAMRTGETSDANSMALAIRDITDLSREEMWDDFPDLRPHPADCQCDRCHFFKCTDPDCQRTKCKEARKPVRYGRTRYRSSVPAAQARGAQAGQSARIIGKSEGLGKRGEIDK